MNQENLITLRERTKEEQREIVRKGGIASGEARRRKKTMKENFEALLSLPIKNNKLKEQIKSLGIEDEEMTNQMALIIAMYQKALKGDVSAFNTIRDTKGETITNNVKVEQVPIINDDIK